MFRNIITLLILCCISLTANAQEITLKEGHPNRHVVVKGDTLWDIAGKFLKDPWLWPQVWKQNRADIQNPHLIYPGDVIFLDENNGRTALRLLRESTMHRNGDAGHASAVTLYPEVIIEPLAKQAIPTISLSSIAPFLNQPLIIEKNALKGAPRIIAGQDDRVILSPNTTVYVNAIDDGNTINHWYIYRQGEALKDPQTETDLGYEAIYLGEADITKNGNPATALITKAKEEIFVKDRLMAVNNQHQISFTPHAPDHTVDGRILKIYGSLSEAASGSVVSINRGSDNGIEVGHVLAIKQLGRMIVDTEVDVDDKFSLTKTIKNVFSTDKKTKKEKQAKNMIKLPDERSGLIMIFRTFKNVAYGLVMQTKLPVKQFDTVTNP